MYLDEKTQSHYLAMSELTKEIGSVVQNSIDKNNQDLTPSDIEYILKITSDVTSKISTPEIKEIIV